jgi:hypothetical protein
MLTPATSEEDPLKVALRALSLAWDNLRPHDDNCYLHDDDDGGVFDRCFCGRDSLVRYLEEVTVKLESKIATEEYWSKRADELFSIEIPDDVPEVSGDLNRTRKR